MDTPLLYQQFPFLNSILTKSVSDHTGGPKMAHIPAGEVVFEAGDPCTMIPLLVKGEIRVFSLGENGREMTLYRIHPGESCILSISSLLGHSTIPAIAQVEQALEVLVIPSALFSSWMNQFEEVRTFVYSLMARMLADVITTVDEVAFRRLDERIIELLQERADQNKAIFMTHQQIAVDLASSREVVSRILKDFEHKKRVTLGRGVIHLTD